jgi:predicted ATP-grasp superfamily ATP-dependent carboligase
VPKKIDFFTKTQSVNRTERRLKILLSEGSSNSARQTLYGLGRKYSIDIVDPSPWCQCRYSSLVHRWYRCPPAAKDPAAYVACVVDWLKRNRYDVLFPTHEQVYLLSRYRDLLGKRVGLAVPDFESLRRMQSKAEFARLMAELGLPIPACRIVDSERDIAAHDQFPCYLKLVHSTASLGVKRAENREGLIAGLAEFKRCGLWQEGTEILIQQPAHGGQAEVNAVFQHGRLVAASCLDVLCTGIGGGPAQRVSANHAHVIDHVGQLGGYLQWHGPLVLEYFYDDASGKPEYIEANPRIGESVNAQLSGVNVCEIVARISLEENVETLTVGNPGVRSHNGFILLIADAYNGANRRELLKRLWAGWTRRGIYATFESEMTRPREDWGSLIPATVVTLGLLANPRSAIRLTQNTVANYSLPQNAASIIEGLPDLPESNE